MSFDRKAYMKEYNARYFRENREREYARQKKWRKDNPEKAKALTRRNAQKWRTANPERSKEIKRQWVARNYGKVQANIKKQNNSELNKDRQARYRVKHRSAISARTIAKRKSDPIEYLKYSLRRRVRNALAYQGVPKSQKTLDLIGCSIHLFREHIEGQFTKDMSWDNYGKTWELDHIIPISHFDLTIEEEQKKAFNYLNTRPLGCFENRSRGNRLKI